MGEPAIAVRGLTKRYGDVVAVDGIDLEVRAGEVLAFLGPNGAGKTTATEILEGHRPRTGGAVSVLGEDPQEAGRSWKARIGIVLQSGSTQTALTPRETLELWASYYPAPRDVGEVLALVGLTEKADARIATLSGGQRRRVEVGLALIGGPELVFLDEPTTGFDPDARRQFWGVIDGLRETGTTIFLTTHYLEEAQALADRVAIIKEGRIVAEGTPAELSARAGTVRVAFRLPDGAASDDLPPLPGELWVRDGRAELLTAAPTAAVGALAAWAARRGRPELEDLAIARPSLEDVYLELVR
jgi:ABC-2 type transport system ATP-binding protein